MKSLTMRYSKGSRCSGVARSVSSLSMVPPVSGPVRIASGFGLARVLPAFFRQAERALSFGPQPVIDAADAARLGCEREIGVHEFQRCPAVFLSQIRFAEIGFDRRSERLGV